MKLGIITDDFYPFTGGMGRYVYEIAQRLPQEKLLIFSPCKNDISNHVKLAPPLHRKLRNLSFSLWLHQNIEYIIKEYNLTRINIQCGPGGLFLIKRPSVPVIATCHHTYWQQSRYIPSQFWKRIFVPFEGRTYSCADKIVCQSKDVRRILTEQYHLNSEGIAVIPIGVDTSRFYPIPGTPKIPNSLLYVGRIEKRKGIDFLLRAMPFVVKQISDVKLFIAGAGKEVKRIKRYIHELRLEENIQLLGFVIEEDLNELYNKVRCIIVPSIFEGFGLTAIEAMAAGTPVIGTNVDGLREVIQNDVNGLLVRYNDVAALSQSIVHLLGDNAKQTHYIQEGIRKVVTTFNWDTISKRVFRELYPAAAVTRSL